MNFRKSTISHEALLLLLDYNSQTGVFSWNPELAKRRGKRRGVAGAMRRDGYVQIKVSGTIVMAHRLAWFYVYGSWPDKFIDHINRDKADNRICNLRQASKSENAQNQSLNPRNTTGVPGVTRAGSSFIAQIKTPEKHLRLGSFKNKEAAAEAYRIAALKYFGPFAPAEFSK